MFANRKMLLTEDCPEETQVIKRLAHSIGLVLHTARSLEEGLEKLRTESFDLLLTDLHINSRVGVENPDGLNIIREARLQQPNLTIVTMSSDPRADIWDMARSEGAHHFIRKPIVRADELVIAFQLARERKLFEKLNEDPASKALHSAFELAFREHPEGIIIAESDLRKVKGLARRKTLDCVITGETGTGKEEIAKLIHRYRCQNEGNIPFVAINCSTITQSLAESVLFGHRKGAFTGADKTTVGFIGEADGGILFLDEIHALDLTCQQKLLRVLSDGTYSRLGETREYRSNFQLVAATTKDLDDEVDADRFLIDLRGRLTGIDINLLPLRDRLHDIPAFLSLFLLRNSLSIDADEYRAACTVLQSYYWRGNIRQLFKVLDTWVAHCEFQELSLKAEHIPEFKGMLAPPSRTPQSAPRFDRRLDGASGTAQVPPQGPESLEGILLDPSDFNAKVEAFETLLLKTELQRHRSIADCAVALNLPRSTLDAKRKKYNLLQM